MGFDGHSGAARSNDSDSVGGVQGSHGGKSHSCGNSNISCGVG